MLLITDSQGNSNLSFNNNNVLYVGVDGINSFRELSPNTNFLSTPLGERQNEISRWMSGYSLRMAIPAFRFFKINTGLAILQSGESYDWNSTVTDSSTPIKGLSIMLTYIQLFLNMEINYLFTELLVSRLLFLTHSATNSVEKCFGLRRFY